MPYTRPKIAGTAMDQRRWPRRRRPDGTYAPDPDSTPTTAKQARNPVKHVALHPEQVTAAAAALDRVCVLMGSKAALAKAMGLQRSRISLWRIAPATRAIDVSEAVQFKVLPCELRPDVYRYATDGVPPHLHSHAIAVIAKRDAAIAALRAKPAG